MMLREALKDPLNHKFALIGDTSLPLYPPATVYVQLLVEPLSRLQACVKGDINVFR